MTDVFAAAVGRWPEIHRALGVPAALLTGRQGPCPKCEGKTRFRFTDHEGKGGFFCNQCGPGDGFDLLKVVHGWDMAVATAEVRRQIGASANLPTLPAPARRRPDPSERAGLWAGAEALDLVEGVRRWWMARVGFVPSCADLRATARLHHGPTASAYPGMIARVLSPCGTRAVQLHRTYLTQAGDKAPVEQARLLMPKIVEGEMDGGAVRLAPHGDALGIAEGIETAVAATALTGIPCWAALTANGLTKWQPPAGVVVTIFADNDSHKRFTGLKAAADLAHRLTGERVKVADVLIPPRKGDDWNDVLLRDRRMAA